jgi:hypothetical protein
MRSAVVSPRLRLNTRSAIEARRMSRLWGAARSGGCGARIEQESEHPLLGLDGLEAGLEHSTGNEPSTGLVISASPDCTAVLIVAVTRPPACALARSFCR